MEKLTPHTEVPLPPTGDVMSRTLLFIPCAFLIGCTVSPSVSYLEVKGSEAEGYTKFHLISGNIVLSESEVKGRNDIQTPKIDPLAKKPSSELTATVVPKEHKTLYALIPKRQWIGMVATNISVSYYDNTRLVHKIGVEVIDNRIKVIEALGAAAKSFASAADGGSDQSHQKERNQAPEIILPVLITPDSTSETWQPLPNNEETGWFYRLRKTSQAPTIDSIPMADFIEAHGESQWYNPFSWFRETSVFPLSSCQDYSLEVSRLDAPQEKEPAHRSHESSPKNSDDFLDQSLTLLAQSKHRKVFGLRIPDPSRVVTIKLPPKGEIVTHTLCGGNVTTQTDSTSSAYDIVSTLIKQAQSLSESQSKSQNKELTNATDQRGNKQKK